MYSTPSFSRHLTRSSAAVWVDPDFEEAAVEGFSGVVTSGAGMAFSCLDPNFSESVDIRFGHRIAPRENREIAAFVGLRDMLGEDRAIAAPVARRRCLPCRAAARELLVGDQPLH